MNYNNRTENYTEFFYYAFRNILIFSLPLAILSALILGFSVSHSSATTSGSDNLAITISSSCTLSSVVNIPHSTEVFNGNHVGNIGKTTVTTLCNDGNGYSVYANGYSNNEEGNNKLINTEYPQYSIDTGLATSGLTSTWAMKLNNIPDDPSPTPPTIESDYNNVYGIVPPYWTKVAGRISGTTDMAEGSSFTTTYAVYASSSQYAGTYQGQVKYLLVHPNINKPTLNNLELAFASHGIQPAYQDETGFYFAMQDMTTDICNSVSGDGETTATQLVDIRDNKLYWVAKLKDGHCWMTQNLDLDLIANYTYTHDDTDLGWDPNSFDVNATWTLTGGPSTITWDSASATYPGWLNRNNLPYSANPGDKYYYTSGSTEDDIVYSSLSECVNAGHTDCKHYSVGNYYNITAAIASNNSTSLNNSNAPNSICPAGWRLPSSSSNDFGILLKNYDIIVEDTGTGQNTKTNYTLNGFNKIRTAPLYFIRSSFRQIDLANSGNYLYNTLTSSGYNNRLIFNDDTVILNNGTYRYDAFPIRCIAR